MFLAQLFHMELANLLFPFFTNAFVNTKILKQHCYI